MQKRSSQFFFIPIDSIAYLNGWIFNTSVFVYFKFKCANKSFKTFAKKAHLGTFQFSSEIQLVVFVKPQL